MLDILEIAKEEGMKEGKTLGLQGGMAQMILAALIERFGVIPVRVSEQIRGIHNQDALKGLFHQALTCQSLQNFETSVTLVF